MDFGIWEKWYNEILDDFGFSKDDDEASAKELDEILFDEGALTLEDLYELIHTYRKSNDFIVFGAGPSLKKHIQELKENYDLNNYTLIAADGATTALIEERIIPDIVATDLDGTINDILLANCRGSLMVIHAHGNNKEAILKYTPFFDNILGTTQSKPHGNLYNFGGFTDGDRAIFLAVALEAENIILAGMDFGDVVTKYSRPNIPGATGPADEIKKKKLVYAEKLTNWVSENEDVAIINLK
ncbi:6-hydroxymethylpterin diphosphokinase MptE-like protein [Methanobrevibacter woesei]|uniref:6-hydroxymethylpterin diphosphokinase MptE-like protein n=1 Tax=Methanobrevibacter woesei TaxID=190976 RepID=UPI0039F53820